MSLHFDATLSYTQLAERVANILHDCHNFSTDNATQTLDNLDAYLHARWAKLTTRAAGTYGWSFAELVFMGTQALRHKLQKNQMRAANGFVGTQHLTVVDNKEIGEYSHWEIYQAIHRLTDAWPSTLVTPSVVDYVGALETSVARFTLTEKPRATQIQWLAYVFHDIRCSLLPLCLHTQYMRAEDEDACNTQWWMERVLPCVRTAGARMFLRTLVVKHFHRPGDASLFSAEMGEPAESVNMERANKQLYGPLFNTLLSAIKVESDLYNSVVPLLPLKMQRLVELVAFDSYMYSEYNIPNWLQTSVLMQPQPQQLHSRMPFLCFIGGNIGVGAFVHYVQKHVFTRPPVYMGSVKMYRTSLAAVYGAYGGFLYACVYLTAVPQGFFVLCPTPSCSNST